MVGMAITIALQPLVKMEPLGRVVAAVGLGEPSSSSGATKSLLVNRGGILEVKRGLRTRLRAQDGSKGGFPWFKFGKNGLDSEGAGIYGSQKREDFDRDDVEQYFNYMGMLATEGTYDKMEALLNTGIQAVDILLLLASTEGDKPKIEELLRAGADCRVKDNQGRNALDRARDEEIKELILSKSQAKV